jgi:hypothetical protein
VRAAGSLIAAKADPTREIQGLRLFSMSYPGYFGFDALFVKIAASSNPLLRSVP